VDEGFWGILLIVNRRGMAGEKRRNLCVTGSESIDWRAAVCGRGVHARGGMIICHGREAADLAVRISDGSKQAHEPDTGAQSDCGGLVLRLGYFEMDWQFFL
jgi:hypothetical protein